MGDDESTNDASNDVVEEPAEDPILSALGDTEDDQDEQVVEEVAETPSDEDTDAEGEPEPEQEEETEEESEASDEAEVIDPKEEARQRYEERQRAIAEREARVREQTEEYVSDGEDEYDQRLRTMEAKQYSNLIANNEQTLISEFEQAKANPDLQIFNPDNKDQFNERVYNKAVKDYNAGYVGYDQNGNMTEIKGSLYEHLQETADLLKGASRSGAVQQVRASKNVRRNADTKPAASPQRGGSSKDPILDVLSAD